MMQQVCVMDTCQCPYRQERGFRIMSSTFQERYWILLAVISLTSVLQCQSHNQETSTGSELIQAIARQQVERARGIVHSGANLNVRDRFGTTALAEAIVAHLPGLAEELVIAGADPNFVEGDGTSPLMQAAWHCDLPIAKFLVERWRTSSKRQVLSRRLFCFLSWHSAFFPGPSSWRS